MLRYVNYTYITLVEGLILSFIQLADILPSKTVPKVGRGSLKRKRHSVTVEEVEDEDSSRHLSARSKSPSNNNTIIEEIPPSESAAPTGASKKKKTVRNYIIDFRTLLMQYHL
jgi:hypothetical protein